MVGFDMFSKYQVISTRLLLSKQAERRTSRKMAHIERRQTESM